jgi:hypothetical protein
MIAASVAGYVQLTKSMFARSSMIRTTLDWLAGWDRSKSFSTSTPTPTLQPVGKLAAHAFEARSRAIRHSAGETLDVTAGIEWAFD